MSSHHQYLRFVPIATPFPMFWAAIPDHHFVSSPAGHKQVDVQVRIADCSALVRTIPHFLSTFQDSDPKTQCNCPSLGAGELC